MKTAKVLIFAPADQTGATHTELEAAGCELRFGKASWDTPQGDSEPEMVAMANERDGLLGTSIRNTPISRTVMQSSANLRIVAKYTIGTDDVDVEAATELGILVTHGPTESNWGGVAEGTITAMLTMLKKTRERDRHLKNGGADAPVEDANHRRRSLRARVEVRRARRRARGPRDAPARVRRREPPRRADARDTTDDRRKAARADEARRDPDQYRAWALRAGTGARRGAPPGTDCGRRARRLRGGATVARQRASQPRRQGAALAHMVSSNVGSGLGPGIRWATESVLHALRGEVPDNVYNKDVIPRWQSRFGGRSVWAAT
jgi:hypothetical protein